jgi:single-strand DNA-binding protein
MNLVEITGNLTKDVETRATQSGKSVATLSVAVKRPHSDETDFFNVVVWGNQAENCAKYLKKGSKVGIVGTLQNRSYEANDGTKRTITEIVATEVEFLSPKQAEETQEQVVSVKRERPQLEEIDDNQLPF